MEDLNKIKVENMTSLKGNIIPNQFIIKTDKGMFFQSYDSIIAFVPYGDGKIILDVETWNYSRTTSKYRSLFLRESTQETQRKIKEGIYSLSDLNTEGVRV